MLWPKRMLVAALLAAPAVIPAQTFEYTGDYLTDVAHPRLWLPARRAKLLARETTRDALRWVQFNSFIRGGVKMPEPGFALALYYAATQSQEHGKQAVAWALSPAATDLRQLAIVFDWCQPLLSAADSKALVAKIEAVLTKNAAQQDLASVRDRVAAALAIAGHSENAPHTRYIKPVVEEWWKAKVLTPIQRGETPIDLRDHLALIELFHALRDNLEIDLRETAKKHFTVLPIFHLLAHYPAPFPGAENEYRVPLMKTHGEPDSREMARSRAAALAMVAYDNNAQEMQFLQGWLIQDKFLLRSPYGIPYEFLWANPYQPGLSFHYLPNVFHDPVSGRLIIRSTWEDDATWYYQAPGIVQMFRDGRVINMKQEQVQKQIDMGNTVLLPSNLSGKFSVNTGEGKMHYYVVGLQPSGRYELEVDDEELREVKTDPGGVLELNFPKERTAGVLLRATK
jgi:hypothetical protein